MTWCFIRCQNLGVMTSQRLVRLGGVAANSPRPGVSSTSSLSVPECAVGTAIFYVSCCIIFPGLGQQITIKLVAENSRNPFSHSSGGRKFKLQVSVGSHPPEGCRVNPFSPLQLGVAAGRHPSLLVATSLPSLPLSSPALPSVCLLCLIRTRVTGFRVHPNAG